ncbi:MAG: hypothetical protein WD795_00660 [Woeseia sp.]
MSTEIAVSETSAELPTPLAELAVETFGANYHPDPRTEQPEKPATARDEDQRPAATTTEPTEQPEPDAVWSAGDVELMSRMGYEAAQFQEDLNQWVAVKNSDINALAKGDKGKAQAIRVQLEVTETELRNRYTAIAQAAQALQTKAQAREETKAVKYLQGEMRKLTKERPDFDVAATRRFLQAEGFTNAEISCVTDARLAAIVDDARRYRMQAKKPKGKIPMTKKSNKQRKADPEYRAPIDGGTLRENASTILRQPKREAQPQNVADLSRRLKQSGSIDDAYALLQAKKQGAR